MASRTPARIALLLMIFVQAWQWLLPRKKSTTPRTIWVVHQLLLGDTIMLTGLLAKLRANYPEANIIMLGKTGFADLYHSQPYGVHYWGYQPRSLSSFIQLLRLPKPDWAIVTGDNRYGWLAFVRGAKWISGFAGDRPAYKQWCFDELVALPHQSMAVTEMMQQLCTGISAPAYQVTQWKIHNTQPYQQVVKGAYILFHVGAKSATKHWATENWLALVQYFKQRNKQIVLSAGQGEEAQLDAITQQMDLPNYRANLNLLQLIEVMQKAELIVCLDNGIGQLAKVIATPTICLFGAGSTVLFAEAPFWNKVPYKSITTKIDCRNTHSLFKRQITWIQTCNRSMAACQYKKALCMEHITVAQVINSIEQPFLH